MKVPEDLFDYHASFLIDQSVYQTNPELRQVADIILGWMNVAPGDVTGKGMTVYRTRAVVEIWLKTQAGERYQVGGEWARRTIGIDFSGLELPAVEGPVDPGPIEQPVSG